MVHLPEIMRIADRVHPDHPEAPEMFAERLRLHPAGCLVLRQAGGIAGYAISHPWMRLQVPGLDRRLGRLPDRPDSCLIHDLALLPTARGGGHGHAALLRLQAEALRSGLAWMSLVSLAGSIGFWTRMGFRASPQHARPAEALAAYGPGAVVMERPL